MGEDWSNVTTSETQTKGSSGECNLFGLKQLKEQRDMYIAQNRDEVFSHIVAGKGEHINVLASFSMCDTDQYEQFAHALKASTSDLLKIENSYSSVIDGAIISSGLKQKCHVFN